MLLGFGGKGSRRHQRLLKTFDTTGAKQVPTRKTISSNGRPASAARASYAWGIPGTSLSRSSHGVKGEGVLCMFQNGIQDGITPDFPHAFQKVSLMKVCEGVRRGFWRASWKGSEGVSEGFPWVSGGGPRHTPDFPHAFQKVSLMECCEGVRRGFWRASWKGSERGLRRGFHMGFRGGFRGGPWVSGGVRDKFSREQLSEIVYFATS